jgi:hypothetical protein
LLLQRAQEQAAEQVVLDGPRLTLLVVDHELGKGLGDLFGDEAILDRRVVIGLAVDGERAVAERDRSQREQPLGQRREARSPSRGRSTDSPPLLKSAFRVRSQCFVKGLDAGGVVAESREA